jgi:hypothetical protein
MGRFSIRFVTLAAIAADGDHGRHADLDGEWQVPAGWANWLATRLRGAQSAGPTSTPAEAR